MKPYPSYKDSGIEWLGEIPKHWDLTKIKFQSFVTNGATPKSGEPAYWDGEVVWVTPNDLGKLKSRYLSDTERKITQVGLDSCGTNLAPKNSVVISTRAPIGHLCITETETCSNQGCRTISPKPNQLDSDFLYFLLVVSKGELQVLGQGTTFLELPAQRLKDFAYPKVSLHEQQAIAKFLDEKTQKIDRVISIKEKQIEHLKELRTAIINQAVTKGLDPNVPMKDSGVEWLGEIPDSWKSTKTKYETRQVIDGAHFTPTYVEEGIPFLRVTDIQSQTIDLDSVKRIPEGEHNELIKRCFPQRGDLLLSKNGTIGLTKIVDWDFEFSIFVSLCLIKFGSRLTNQYFFYLFQSNAIDEQIHHSSKKTSVTNLHLDKIKELQFTLPPLPEQQAIANYLDQKTAKIDQSIQVNQKQINQLKEYRTALISEVVTGKVDVREAI